MAPRGYFRFLRGVAPKLQPFTFLLVLFTLFAVNAAAFNSFLQPEEVEEAYSLGQTSNHEELRDFLNQYEHDFKYPSNNAIAFVQSVEFQTPYEQIVLRSLKTTQYTKFRASDDYQANPSLVIVRVVVSLKNGYSGPPPSEDSFNVRVSQKSAIEPRSVTNGVLCEPSNYTDVPTAPDCMAYTREILLRFDASQFAHGNATVRVSLPSQPPVETKYNLDKLK